MSVCTYVRVHVCTCCVYVLCASVRVCLYVYVPVYVYVLLSP